MTLDEVNALDQSAFVAALGGVFENSPWIAAAAWSRRPFASIDALHAALVAAMFDAPEDMQLGLIRAHPELAGKAAVRGDLTVDSRSEQSAAGLTRCSPEEFARLQELNAAYNGKFGFPFIIAVKGLHRRAIIERFAKRLERNRDVEFGEALAQIARIGRLRLEKMLGERGKRGEEPDLAPTRPDVDPVDGLLPYGSMAAIGLQHVLAMYAGAIAVPLIVAGALRLPKDQVAFLVNADLFACGIATLLQCVGFARIGIRLPVAMGTTFAAVGPLLALVGSGVTITGIFGAVIAAGVFTLAVAPFTGRLLRYLPPLVTGTIITVIGITLLRIGINWAGGGAGAKNFGDPSNLAVVALVLLTILVINKLFTGLVANLAVLLGLGIGFVVAMALGMVDFAGAREADWIALVYPFRFGLPTFDFGAIVSLCVVMLVVMVESTGMFLALGEICERRIGPSDIARGLAANGLGTIIGGVFNTFPYTSFAQNVGLVGVSGVRSRWVLAAAGGILIVLGVLPKLGALVASIPQPVLGGAGLVMFGMVAATGIKILARVDYAARHNLLIIAISIAVGMIPLVAPAFFARAPKALGPLLNSGITLAAISAALLNAWFNGRPADETAPD
jgi:OHCU decarboxylase